MPHPEVSSQHNRTPFVSRWIMAVSSGVLWVEQRAIMGLMYVLVALILLNVVTRYSGTPLYWVDESAVYSVVWLTFIGASAMTRLHLDFAMTLLTDRLSPRAVRIAKIIADFGVVAFALLLGWMCWLWLDPAGLARAGFDAKAFSAQSFNFVYTERTQTLNWPTWALYLILPLFSVTMVIHGLANALEDMDLAPRTTFEGFEMTQADGIN